MTARRRLLASGLTLALGAGLLVASAGTAAAATITVNSLADTTADDGSCTLREAIDNANFDLLGSDDCAAGSGNDTITFSVTGTIFKGSLPLFISDLDGLTIQGPGANLLTLDGGGVGSVLVANAPLSLDGLTVANGDSNPAGAGGGIFSDSTLTVTNSTLTGSSAFNGGGISMFNGALTITNSTLSGNDAGSDGGGAIFSVGGTVTITNSTLSDNHADGSGGGIANQGPLTITNSTLSGNSADNSGGGIFHGDGFLSVTDSTLSGNTAFEGGGIFIDAGEDPLIVNSTFEGNHADSDGGGIYNLGFLEITNSTFNTNTADGRGGGLFNGNVFSSPDPGTLSVSAARVEITNATFSGNSALGEVEMSPTRSLAVQQAGGGIFNAVDAIPVLPAPDGRTRLVTEPYSVILRGTIVDHSLQGGDCSGPITDDGYNLDSDATCQLSDETSLIGTDPDLDPLEDNGGPTQTMALNTGSPALDHIPPGVCEHFLGHSPKDQRGITRPQGDGCDIGAFELEVGGTTPPPPQQGWVEQTTIDLRGPFGASASLRAERSSFKLKGTLYARHWFCQHNSKINLILVGQGQIGSTFTNGAGDFAFLTSLPQGENQASYKARFPQKRGQPGRCKGSVSDPLVVTGG